ncbi:hypothetical protein NP493_1729g00048 [Ridgeia piscesae]|uniref:Reverse transcriptase domain-containing protein n=1 Tax=Ridgeia piscesae TaxID=27915 RepID=A0AAD9JVP2_RIDPI|nr:hypothetical protein NP493_1729g00048 [Ridgeia piscesae]
MDRELPRHWTIINIIPIPKSGDTKTDNYRGISLSSVVAKVYNRMILNIIRPKLDPWLRINQNGFGGREPPPHNNTSDKVLTPEGETDTFPILAGVLQGDTLAPYLFIIVLDYALRRAMTGKEEQLEFTITPGKSRRFRIVIQTDFDFADDIALVSVSVEKAQTLLLGVEGEFQKMSLQLNAKKTEVITFNINEKTKITTKNCTILAVNEVFKYIGSYISSTENDIRRENTRAVSIPTTRSYSLLRAEATKPTRLLQKRTRALESDWWERKAKALELQRVADRNNMNGFYTGLKEVWGPKKKGPDQLKSTGGMETFSDSKKVVARWSERF